MEFKGDESSWCAVCCSLPIGCCFPCVGGGLVMIQRMVNLEHDLPSAPRGRVAAGADQPNPCAWVPGGFL